MADKSQDEILQDYPEPPEDAEAIKALLFEEGWAKVNRRPEARAGTSEPARWSGTPPEEDGYALYKGRTPNGEEEITAVVQLVTHIKNGERWAVCFLPPYWLWDKERRQGTMHWAEVVEWDGLWAAAGLDGCAACVKAQGGRPAQVNGGVDEDK